MHTRADAADIYICPQRRKTKRKEREDESSCILYSMVDDI
jgi:hypothetical protein